MNQSFGNRMLIEDYSPEREIVGVEDKQTANFFDKRYFNVLSPNNNAPSQTSSNLKNNHSLNQKV